MPINFLGGYAKYSKILKGFKDVKDGVCYELEEEFPKLI